MKKLICKIVKYLTDLLSEVATWCNHDPIPDPIVTIQYGALYNWYAATDAREICASGWKLPSGSEYNTLYEYCNNDLEGARKLCEVNLDYWDSVFLFTNELKLNLRGSGYRDFVSFNNEGFKTTFYAWLSGNDSENGTSSFAISSGIFEQYYPDQMPSTSKYYGLSIRLIKESTTLTHGQTGTYTGNDGKVYRTICIGTQEWLADNLAETKYRNGDDIPEVTDDATWAALVTGAMCYYDNDSSNV